MDHKAQGTAAGLPYMSAGLFAQLADDSSGKEQSIVTMLIRLRYLKQSKSSIKATMDKGTPDTILVNQVKKNNKRIYCGIYKILSTRRSYRRGLYFSIRL